MYLFKTEISNKNIQVIRYKLCTTLITKNKIKIPVIMQAELTATVTQQINTNIQTF